MSESYQNTVEMVEGHYKLLTFQTQIFQTWIWAWSALGWKKDPIKLKDILTMNLSTPSLNQGLSILRWLKSPLLKSLGLKSLWLRNPRLKSSLLKSPGLKLGVEKSGVEMSFNLTPGLGRGCISHNGWPSWISGWPFGKGWFPQKMAGWRAS